MRKEISISQKEELRRLTGEKQNKFGSCHHQDGGRLARGQVKVIVGKMVEENDKENTELEM